MKNNIELRTGELFCGAGGLSLGFILANHPLVRFQPIFAIDNDPYSLRSYESNMKWLAQNVPDVLPYAPRVYERDIDTLNVRAVLRLFRLKPGQLDLLLGGPPCQGFSTANRRDNDNVKSGRNRLIKVFLDRLNEFRPKMFLLENVQGLRWTKPTQDMAATTMQKSLFEDIETPPVSVQDFLIRKAESLGYTVWYDILDAVDFGVPQHRMRFFLFGIRSDIVHQTNAQDLGPLLARLLVSEKIPVIKAIGDLPELQNGERWIGEAYHPADEDYVKKMRRYMMNGNLYDHYTTRHAEYVLERYKKIPEGGNWEAIRHEMSNYKKVQNTHSNIYRRLRSTAPAHTISHYRKAMTIHPFQNRGISFREACRLQSFPDWFRFQGPTDEQQQQLANAVPPLMASVVAWAIAECWSTLMRESSPQDLLTLT